MAHHGRAATRVPALPARGNQRVPGDEHSPLASFITRWPSSCCWTGSGPHGCCARPAVDPGFGEDHAWAGTVRSARNPARSSATMGRRRLRAARSSPRPRFPTRGCRGRRRVRRPGRLSGRTPRAWPGTAWIGELTATGRSSSGQTGQPPACRARRRFFAFSKESWPDRRVSGWPGPLPITCIGWLTDSRAA